MNAENVIAQRSIALKDEISRIENQEEKYKYLIQQGKALPPMAEEKKLDKFLIEGCMSRAWLSPKFESGKIFFEVDSEASIVKGIMAVLMRLCNGLTPQEILDFNPEILQQLGILEQLSMNRRTGLNGLLKQMKLYAIAFRSLSV